jgi:3-oxoisoapionate decarboxylase
MLTRRQVLTAAGVASAFGALRPSEVRSAPQGPGSAGTPLKAPKMGGAPTAFSNRNRGARGGGPGGARGGPGGARGGAPVAPASAPAPAPGPAFDIIEYCHSIGLAGVQTNPPSNDPAEIKKFRARLEAYNMHLVCDLRFPRQGSGDLAAVEEQIKACKDAGAVMFHAAMTGRRYEDFDALEPWKAMFDNCQKQVALVEPLLKKYQMKLAIENHKGWRAPENVAWLKKLGSPWVGVCLDFGNNMSLCEDPMDTLNTLLPYVFFAHIKDMAVEEYEDGFLLSEVPMGEGMLDLKQMVQILRQKDPNMIFDLEMITRDPLKIPIYTPKYWATFDDTVSPLPGREVAKMMALVKKNKPKKPLPKTTGLSPEAAAKLEEDYNKQCIAYGRANLAL